MTPKKTCFAALLVSFLFFTTSLSAQEPDKKVDLNTATAKQIAKAMKSVGKRKAVRIVEFRTMHGPFPTLEALDEVKGISKRIIEKNKDRVEVIPIILDKAMEEK